MTGLSRAEKKALDAATNAISRGLKFLCSHQLPTGQFPIQATSHYKPGNPVIDDSSPFATSHILYSLSFFADAEVQDMVKPALAYLRREMAGSGLWRYWNRDAVWDGRRIISFIPADLDDTASHSWLLRRYGIPFPDNRALLLQNRDRQGRFYTWFVPRLRSLTNVRYWVAVLSELTLGRMILFWQKTEASYNDVDAVVNANVLLYLGQCSATKPVIEWLVRLVEEGRENSSDKWYRDIFTFHYALSRCSHAGISGFENLQSLIADRLSSKLNPDGSFGTEPMHTALALNTVWNLGASMDPRWIRSALTWLISKQDSDGGWPSAPYYYGGPKQSVSWGSRELTTALCLEALIRSSEHSVGSSNQ